MERRLIGKLGNVTLDVAAWDGAGAQVDLSSACMFAHEIPGHVISGGLLHLDLALGGALTVLRGDGDFGGRLSETLLLTRPPGSIAARAILVIGLGSPEDWTPNVMEQAVATAARFAIAKGVGSVAFAPSLLDSGIEPAQAGASGAAMMAGLRGALCAQNRLVALGLTEPAALSSWTFDAGLEHLEAATASFKAMMD